MIYLSGILCAAAIAVASVLLGMPLGYSVTLGAGLVGSVLVFLWFARMEERCG